MYIKKIIWSTSHNCGNNVRIYIKKERIIMSFWADEEKTGRLDELCCLLFPRRAQAEFLSLAPTPWHLGQFPQELKDEGTLGTKWKGGGGGSVSQSEWEKRRHKRWIEKPEWRRRARESQREAEWRTQEESLTLGEKVREVIRLCSDSWGRRWWASHDSVRDVRPPIPHIVPPNRVTAAMFLLLETERRRRPNWSQVRVFRSGHYGREGRGEPGDGGRREEVGRRAWASRRSVRLYSNEDTEERLAGWLDVNKRKQGSRGERSWWHEPPSTTHTHSRGGRMANLFS